MTNQAKVGIVALIALICLGMIVVWKSSLFLNVTGYEMIGSFESIEGLTVGSEIRYRGFKVGKVMRIDPGIEDIRIYCNILIFVFRPWLKSKKSRHIWRTSPIQ